VINKSVNEASFEGYGIPLKIAVRYIAAGNNSTKAIQTLLNKG
jgi:hypothetical protein